MTTRVKIRKWKMTRSTMAGSSNNTQGLHEPLAGLVVGVFGGCRVCGMHVPSGLLVSTQASQSRYSIFGDEISVWLRVPSPPVRNHLGRL